MELAWPACWLRRGNLLDFRHYLHDSNPVLQNWSCYWQPTFWEKLAWFELLAETR